VRLCVCLCVCVCVCVREGEGGVHVCARGWVGGGRVIECGGVSFDCRVNNVCAVCLCLSMQVLRVTLTLSTNLLRPDMLWVCSPTSMPLQVLFFGSERGICFCQLMAWHATINFCCIEHTYTHTHTHTHAHTHTFKNAGGVTTIATTLSAMCVPSSWTTPPTICPSTHLQQVRVLCTVVSTVQVWV
jgi:hypothetical protein